LKNCIAKLLTSFTLSLTFKDLEMSTAQNQTPVDIDSLLDGTLDDLADVPEFKPFPAGAHRVIVTLTQKVINNHPSIEVAMKATETLELAKPEEDKPLVPGAQASVAYMLDNELGQGNFKRILIAAKEKFGPKTNRELMEDMQNAECLVVTSIRQNKDKTAQYTEIKEIQVV
jgi:hypothetical protein